GAAGRAALRHRARARPRRPRLSSPARPARPVGGQSASSMSDPIRVLELRSVWGTGGGPDKTILGGVRLLDPAHVATTVCYIRDARDTVYALDRRAAELKLDYVEVIERNSFDRRIWPALKALVRERRIDIVHAHDHKTDLVTWLLAKATGVVPLSTAHG